MLSRIFFVKLVHTIVFFFQITCLSYILFAAVTRTFNWLLVLAMCSIALNGLLLLLNKGRCPFTTLAEKCGAQKGSVTDMFLPSSVANRVLKGSTVLFSAEVVLLAFRYFSGI